jgi:ribosome-binding protein aMBF1 (putative translation factor)
MKKILALSLGFLLTGVLTAHVNAEQDGTPAFPNQESQVQSDQGQTQAPEQQGAGSQVTPNDPSMSLDARYKQRIENKNRAAEMRQKLLSEGQEQTPLQTPQ